MGERWNSIKERAQPVKPAADPTHRKPRLLLAGGEVVERRVKGEEAGRHAQLMSVTLFFGLWEKRCVFCSAVAAIIKPTLCLWQGGQS